MSGANGWASGRLVVVGVSHHTAPVELREKLALDPEQWYDQTAELPTVLLATCNRVEVYAWGHGRGAPEAASIRRALAAAAHASLVELSPHVFVKTGQAALVHLVRVTAGLDSLVVGEEQIRGQVREAHRLAARRGSLPSPLDGVFSRALEAGRRLRATTSIGRQPSVAAAAVHAARRLPPLADGRLAGQTAIVLGAGVMAKSAAQSLLEAGAGVVLLNRTPDHAEQLRGRLGPAVRTGALADLPALLPDAAILVGSTAAHRPVVEARTIRTAMAGRDGRPLVVLDIAMPRDVEPDVRDVPGVILLDLDDLLSLCPVDADTRDEAVNNAEAQANAEAAAIARWLRVRAVSPAIIELRRFGQDVQQVELQRAAGRLRDLTPEEWQTVQAMTKSIVNKLLHGPTVAVREAAVERPSSTEGVLDLFGVRRARHLKRS